VTPEAERFLAKAMECLQDAQRFAAFAPRIAAREAHLTAFHAAEALIHDRSGQVARRIVASASLSSN